MPGIKLRDLSSVYLTEPVGFESAHLFYNLVARIETILSPWEVMLRCLEIELRLGRKRSGRMEDRVVDLDLLLYEREVLQGEWLSLPHPRLAERAFVLVPLVEIAPDLEHPVLRRSMRDLLRDLDSLAGVRVLGSLDHLMQEV